MSRFSKSEIEEMIVYACESFKQLYPKGATFKTVSEHENKALKQYLSIYLKNIQNGKTRYNSQCKKVRDAWFALESIKCIMEVCNLTSAKNLDFCIDNMDEVSAKLQEFINSNSFQSYMEELDIQK